MPRTTPDLQERARSRKVLLDRPQDQGIARFEPVIPVLERGESIECLDRETI
jgi:hypothetical protein